MPSNQNTQATQRSNTPAAVTTLSFGERLAKGGNEAIEEKRSRYAAELATRGIGTHYGDHSTFQRMNYREKLDALQEMLKPGARMPRPDELKRTSCIDWALETMLAAYEKAGRGARGREIYSIVVANKAMGTVLCAELQKDGWTSLFWAKDSKNPDVKDSADRKTHQGYINMATRQKRYWVKYPESTMRVDDYVMDYKLSEDSTHAPNTNSLERLKKIPFAIGVAKGGMHCFSMRNGVVSENHWDAGPDADVNRIFQDTKLEDFDWSSGLIMVPPGTWKSTAS